MIVNAVPLLPGYRWHRTARIWRTPLLGEFSMGMTFRFTLRQLTRESNVDARAAARGVDRQHLAHFDQGTQRAILRLYRSSPPDEARRRRRAASASCDVPALVVWGTRDPYIPARFGRDYAAALPQARARRVPGRRALGVARPARHGRPRRRLPERRVSARGASRARRAAPRRSRCCDARRRGRSTALLAIAYLIARAAEPRPRRRQLSQPPVLAASASRSGTTAGTAATTCRPTRCSPRRSAR